MSSLHYPMPRATPSPDSDAALSPLSAGSASRGRRGSCSSVASSSASASERNSPEVEEMDGSESEQEGHSGRSDSDSEKSPLHPPLPASAAALSAPPSPSLPPSRARVLVTGGAGFIGSHVCRALLQRGEDVAIVDELNDFYDPAVKLQNLKALLDDFGHARVHVYVADICNAAAMAKAFEAERFDRIVHLAARAGVRPSIDDPLLYERTNVQGTLTLLELAKSSKGAIKHFVYASSSSVYGDDAAVPFSELDPCNTPVSPYAASKKSCEMLASTYAHLHGIPCSGLRFFTVFGPRGRMDMAPYIFIDRLARGFPIQQFGDGTTERDYTYIDDIVQGVLKVLDHPPVREPVQQGNFLTLPAAAATSSSAARHEVYNLGVGAPISLSDFIQTIAKELGVEPNIVVLPKQPGDVDRTFADVSKAHDAVGYKPTISVAEGIRRTVAWYRSAQLQSHDEEAIPSAVEAATLTAPAPEDGSAPFSPLHGCLCATRIHNQGSTRVGLSPDVFSHLLIWLPRALSCAQFVAIAVDTTDGRTDIKDAVATVVASFSAAERARVSVVGVSPWLAFVPALNALLATAQTLQCTTILYSSLEIQMHPAHIHALHEHLLADTLVVGARLSGHRFVRGSAVIDGCSTVWNTMALWNAQKLQRTGFLQISDGLPEREAEVIDPVTHARSTTTLPAVAGGVEEVVCISMQQAMFPADSHAKLLSMTTDEAEPWKAGSGLSVAASAATTSAASEEEEMLYDDVTTPLQTLLRCHSDPQATSTLTAASSRTPLSSAAVKAALAAQASTSQRSVSRTADTPLPASAATKTAVSAARIPSLFWDASFGGDPEREAWHEKKMRSKIERPQQQLEHLNLKPGVIEHIHCTLHSR